MKKRIFIILIVFLVFIGFILILYPNIEFSINDKLYDFSYNEDWSEWEENMCYNESYSYNKERDISIYNWEFDGFLWFKWAELKYKKGNVCDTEYFIEEVYIEKIIKEAEIIENEDNINLKELINGKEAIVGNKKYFGNNYETYMSYKLDDEYKELYVFYVDDLLVIQIGNTDEGPKFIAYK